MWIKVEDTKTDLGKDFTMTVITDESLPTWGEITLTATVGTPFSGYALTDRVELYEEDLTILLKPKIITSNIEVTFTIDDINADDLLEDADDFREELESGNEDIVIYERDNGDAHKTFTYNFDKVIYFSVDANNHLILEIDPGIARNYYNNVDEIKEKLGYED